MILKQSGQRKKRKGEKKKKKRKGTKATRELNKSSYGARKLSGIYLHPWRWRTPTSSDETMNCHSHGHTHLTPRPEARLDYLAALIHRACPCIVSLRACSVRAGAWKHREERSLATGRIDVANFQDERATQNGHAREQPCLASPEPSLPFEGRSGAVTRSAFG